MVEELLSLKKMLAMSWIYLLILVLGSWIIGSWSFAWGVMAGGIISIVSFMVSQREVTAFVDSLAADPEGTTEKRDIKNRKKGFIFKFWLRLLLIGFVLFLLIRYSDINVFGLILGLTTIVFTVNLSAFGAVWNYFSRR